MEIWQKAALAIVFAGMFLFGCAQRMPWEGQTTGVGPGNVACGDALDTAGSLYTLAANSTINGSSCFDIIADNVILDCGGFTIAGNNTPGTVGIQNNATNATIRNCIVKDFDYGVYFSEVVIGSHGYSSLSNTSISAMQQDIIIDQTHNNFTGLSLTGVNVNIYITNSENNISNFNASGQIGLQTDAAYNNTFSNFNVTCNNPISCIRFISVALASHDTTFRDFSATNTGTGTAMQLRGHDNVVLNGTLSGANLLLVTGTNNTICLNNFTATSGYYVNDTNGSNSYNCTYNGKNQGNLYANILDGSVAVAGTETSSIAGYYLGSAGAGYPYNNTTSAGKFSCNFAGCGDRAPLTKALLASACGDLNVSGEYYELTANVSINGSSCFNATAANVTLDCAGFSIIGDDTNATYGIHSNQTGTVVKNCNIGGFMHGVFFNGTTYGQIINTTAASNLSLGTALYVHSDGLTDAYATIVNSSGVATGTGRGIFLEKTSRNTIINSNGTANVASGIYLYVSSSNNITGAVGVSSNAQGLFVQEYSNNNTMSGCQGFSSSGDGMQIFTAFDNVFTNTNGTSDTGAGIKITTSDNNTLIQCAAVSNTFAGFLVIGDGTHKSTSNKIINSFISTNTSPFGALALVEGVDNSTVANTTINGGGSDYGVSILSKPEVEKHNLNNTFINNTILNATTLLLIPFNSSANLFYWNNFTSPSTTYVNDMDGGNFYNATEGNVYGNVLNGSIRLSGGVASGRGGGLFIATYGSGVPYNNSTSNNTFICDFAGCGDYRPLTDNAYCVDGDSDGYNGSLGGTGCGLIDCNDANTSIRPIAGYINASDTPTSDLLICTGTYTARVSIGTNITVDCNGSTIVNELFQTNGHNATLKNCNFANNTWAYSIALGDFSNATFKNITFSNVLRGIYKSSSTAINNLYIDGIVSDYANYTVVEVTNSNNMLAENIIANHTGSALSGDCFACEGCSNATVRNSVCDNPVRYGFRYWLRGSETSSNVTFLNITVKNSTQSPVQISTSSTPVKNATIANSTFTNNKQPINLGDTVNVTIYGNTFSTDNSSVGFVDLSTSTYGLIYLNYFLNSSSPFSGGGSNTIIYDNYFNNTATLSGVASIGYNTTKDCTRRNIIGGNCTGGNFWNYYTGGSSLSDGIGDTPYQLSSGVYDYLPLTNTNSTCEDKDGDGFNTTYNGGNCSTQPIDCNDNNSAIYPPAGGSIATSVTFCNGTYSNLSQITVTTANVTITCNGTSLVGNNTALVWGIYSTSANTTVKNCNISTYAGEIYFASAQDGLIENNTLVHTFNGGSAISVGGNSERASILQNTITVGNATGITLSSRDAIIDCKGANTIGGNFSNTTGIYTSGANTTIRNCNISNFSSGVFASANSDNSTITNVTASTTIAGANIWDNGAGISINQNSRITVANSTGTATKGYGFYIYDNSFSNFTNITGTAISGDGIRFYSSNNSVIDHSTATSKTGRGMSIEKYIYVGHNTVSNSVIHSNNTSALYMNEAEFINLTNNTFADIPSNAISMDNSNNISIVGNVFNNTTSSGLLIVANSSDLEIRGNVFLNSGRASLAARWTGNPTGLNVAGMPCNGSNGTTNATTLYISSFGESGISLVYSNLTDIEIGNSSSNYGMACLDLSGVGLTGLGNTTSFYEQGIVPIHMTCANWTSLVGTPCFFTAENVLISNGNSSDYTYNASAIPANVTIVGSVPTISYAGLTASGTPSLLMGSDATAQCYNVNISNNSFKSNWGLYTGYATGNIWWNTFNDSLMYAKGLSASFNYSPVLGAVTGTNGSLVYTPLNAGFEAASLANWTYTGGVASRSGTQNHSGNYSAKISQTGNASTLLYQNLTSLNLTNGTNYTAIGWLYIPSGQTSKNPTGVLAMGSSYASAINRKTYGQIESNNTTDTWMKIELPFTYNDSTALYFNLFANETLGIGEADVYWDDVSIENITITSNPGQAEGNIWANVINGSVQVAGSNRSAYGNGSEFYIGVRGAGYPYSDSTSNGMVNGLTDYAPLTDKTDTCAPPSSGNWLLACSDNCDVTSSFNVSTIFLNGTGRITFRNLQANFTKYDTSQARACNILWMNSTASRRG